MSFICVTNSVYNKLEITFKVQLMIVKGAINMWVTTFISLGSVCIPNTGVLLHREEGGNHLNLTKNIWEVSHLRATFFILQ